MRKLARQVAFLILYAVDMGKFSYPDVLQYYMDDEHLMNLIQDADLDKQYSFNEFEECIDYDDKIFIMEMVSQTREHLEDIDQLIEKHSIRWSIDRMPSTDRNILRLGAFEIRFNQEAIDAPIIINEAVELAKIYGDEESYKFVNAVLDAIVKSDDVK